MDAAPDVLNHNIETVPRLYRQVRLGARYERSLEMLAYAKQLRPNIPTKSGVMLGLGETNAEVLSVMRDLHAHNVDILTLGQYLRPSQKHLPILRYVPVEEFAELRREGIGDGLRAYRGRSAGAQFLPRRRGSLALLDSSSPERSGIRRTPRQSHFEEAHRHRAQIQLRISRPRHSHTGAFPWPTLLEQCRRGRSGAAMAYRHLDSA